MVCVPGVLSVQVQLVGQVGAPKVAAVHPCVREDRCHLALESVL